MRQDKANNAGQRPRAAEPSAPHFSRKDAAHLANSVYGVDGRVDAMPSYADQNFLIETASQEKFVLKIANRSEKVGILDAQNQAMSTVAAAMNPGCCPQVRTSVSGHAIETVPGPDGLDYHVRMLTFVPGELLADLRPFSTELLRSLGRFLGQLDQALADLYLPAAHRDSIWNLSQTARLVPETHHISQPERRRLVDYFLLQFENEVLPWLPSVRQSLIHNDANDYNLIVGKDRVTGIIDFGDLAIGCTVGELAIACAYVLQRSAEPIEAAGQIVAGYHETYPLLPAETDVLFYLIAARLCASVTICARQKKLEPDNEYLSVSEEPGWQLLEKLIGMNPIAAGKRFREACEMSAESPVVKGLPPDEIVELRNKHIGKSLSVSYQEPLKIVRGAMQYLFAQDGRSYLDCVNNVCHVGHCHPHVVRAVQKQMAALNTNTRYLHDNLVEYAQRLTDTLPAPLEVCYFVNSGSEANDLALRLAHAFTLRKDIITLDGAYHGNLSSLIEISPYKFDGPGGCGAPPHVHTVPLPDVYRGAYKSSDAEAGRKYAAAVAEQLDIMQANGRKPAAFICESLPGCAGQIVLPEGYLPAAFEHVRAAGGVCIADEVQVGFGRAGVAFWGFETQNVIPDIVTLGKPIGNGHPLGAVVTTREIADAFANGMEYFNTFGGNPVSCAAGLAVIDVLEEENLQAHALAVGAYLKKELASLKRRHSLVGDVRGLGLFLGVELVADRQDRQPAAGAAREIVEALKERGILVSVDGPLHNVLKIKPPLVFNLADADRLAGALDEILAGCKEW